MSRDMTFRLFGQDVSASKAVEGVGKASATTGKKLEEHGKRGHAAGLAMAGGLLFAGKAAVDFAHDSIDAYADAEKSQARLEDAYRRFPAMADVSIESLRELNSTLEAKTGFDDDAIASGQAVLAQFKMSGQQVKGLTPLLVDYAAKTGKDVPTAAKTLGKAFLGNTRALKDLGINYKATGHQAKDTAAITDLLRQKVGGFAEREGKTGAGQAKILGAEFGEVEEQVGQQLLPALMKMARFLLDDVIPAVKTTVKWLGDNKDVVVPLVAAIAAGVAAYKAYTMATKAAAVVQALLNGEMEANPIGIVVVALAALAAGLIYAYKHSETFRNIVNGALHGVTTAAHAVVGFFTGPFLRAIGTLVGIAVKGFKFLADAWFTVVGAIVHGGAKAFGWVRGIGGKLKKASKAFDGFRSDVDSILSATAADAETWGHKTGRDLADGAAHGIDEGAYGVKMAGKLMIAQTIKEMRLAADAHSPSRETYNLGGDLAHGLAYGWGDAMRSLIAKMPKPLQQLLGDLQAKVTAAVAKTKASVAAARQQMHDALDARRQFADQLKSSLTDSAGITGAINPETGQVGNVGAFLSGQGAKLQTFARDLAMLRKRGIAPALLQQIANAGPDQGIALAQALLSGSSGSFASLNSAQAQISKYAGQAGTVAAGGVYDKEIGHDKRVLKDTLAEQKHQTRILELIAERLQGRMSAKQLQAELLKLKRQSGQKLGLD